MIYPCFAGRNQAQLGTAEALLLILDAPKAGAAQVSGPGSGRAPLFRECVEPDLKLVEGRGLARDRTNSPPASISGWIPPPRSTNRDRTGPVLRTHPNMAWIYTPGKIRLSFAHVL